MSRHSSSAILAAAHVIMIMAVRESSSCSTPTPYEGEVRSRIYLRVPGEADMKKGGDEDVPPPAPPIVSLSLLREVVTLPSGAGTGAGAGTASGSGAASDLDLDLELKPLLQLPLLNSTRRDRTEYGIECPSPPLTMNSHGGTGLARRLDCRPDRIKRD
ncbi:short chain dehydrogenase [Marssonina coronariae]|uniref:Short chain dehydrogenase n=1 Tax=Diplocarpon coronariae TaxID=2795749 RepID=A0A218ZB81_9HELO|nr:short chain dehydrogenase [Marssonina coronariae]